MKSAGLALIVLMALVVSVAVAGMQMTVPWPGAQASLDGDGDGIPDAEDNCPAWPNADQSEPWWSGYAATDDPDCDGWTTAEEQFIGTDPLKHCCETAIPDDEVTDSWPPDFNDDQEVNILDIVAFLPACFPEHPPGLLLCGYYDERFDLTADGKINILDIVQVTPPMFGTSCAS